MGTAVPQDDLPKELRVVPEDDLPKELKSASSFQSGSAFKDTKDLASDAWEAVKKAWHDKDHPTDFADKLTQLKNLYTGAGNASADILGGLPAMGIGAAHGVGTAITNLDASKGLQQAGETMNSLMPSTLLGNQNVQQSGAYRGMMAPVTAAMDTVNAIPQGFGEMANASGFPNAAGQITDAGKLAAMAAMSVGGAHGLYKGLRPDAPRIEPVQPTVKPVEQPQPHISPEQGEGVGVPPSAEQPQGQLWSNPTRPMDSQMTLPGMERYEHGDKGVSPTPEQPQGSLFSEQPTKPIPDRAQTDMLEQTQGPAPTIEPGLSSKSLPENPAMSEAFKKAEMDKAYEQHDAVKQAALDELQRTQRDWEQRQEHVEIARTQGELDYQHLKDVVGDKNLMSEDHTTNMTDAIRSGDLKGAVSEIAENHPNGVYRQLANYLGDKLEGINTKYHPETYLENGDRQYSGYFDPSTGTVGFSGVGASSPHTVLHETVHALTSQFMDDRPNDVRVMGLKNLYNQLDITKFPSISNVKEFVAEAFSNPEFQDYLKTQRVDTRTMWTRFTDGVRNLLGLKPGIETTLGNALDHAIDLGKQVIEASDVNTRRSIMENFQKAGVPKPLADMMTTRPKDVKPVEVVKNSQVQDVVKRLTGLDRIAEQFDFTPKDPKEIIKMVMDNPKDIKSGLGQDIKNQFDSGGLFASLRHENNPVVKSTYAYVDHAVKSYEDQIRNLITDKETGIKPMMQALSKDDFTTVHMQLMIDEGHVERTAQQLSQLGWKQPMIDLAIKLREIGKKILKDFNEARGRMNPPLPPIDARMGHLAGKFVGDFFHLIKDKDDNVIMRINGHTKWGAQDLANTMKQEHPDWKIGKQEYKSMAETTKADRFAGFTELMNYIGKHDPNVAKALDTLDRYTRSTATNYLGAPKHALDKKAAAGGLVGSEGNKAWVDATTNAEEGFKGHLSYLDTTIKWLEMQKAMEKVGAVTSDKGVTDAMPNAIKWAKSYTDHALHTNQGKLADVANSFLSIVGEKSGVGHTNIMRVVNGVSSLEMRAWMGIGNMPFTVKHMVLPLQKMPAMMAYLGTQHLEGNMTVAMLKSVSSSWHYWKDHKAGGGSSFEQAAFDYAHKNSVFNVNLAQTDGKVRSSQTAQFLGKAADIDFSGPEAAIRANSYFFYAHLLKDSGMPVSAALNAAEHLTRFLYTDYAPHEAPQISAKAGWVSQLALQLTRFKMNNVNQMGFYNRERIPLMDHETTATQKLLSNTPLMVSLGSLLAFTGTVGMLARDQADWLYSKFSKHVLNKADNLTALEQRSNVPEMMKYGLSSVLGVDSKISEASLFPSPFPTTTAELGQIGLMYNAVKFHDSFHAKELALSMTPSTLRGLAENKMFTIPKDPNDNNPAHAGKSHYLNPNTGDKGVWRDQHQMNTRLMGYHTIQESEERANNWSQKRLQKDNADLANRVVERAKGLIASGVPLDQVSKQYGSEYMKHVQAGQPDFASAITSYAIARHQSEAENMLYKAANTDKVGNTLQQFKGK